MIKHIVDFATILIGAPGAELKGKFNREFLYKKAVFVYFVAIY